MIRETIQAGLLWITYPQGAAKIKADIVAVEIGDAAVTPTVLQLR